MSTTEKEADVFTVSAKTVLGLVSRGKLLGRKAARAYWSFLRSYLVAVVDAGRGAVS